MLVGFATLPLFLGRLWLLGFESFVAPSQTVLAAMEVIAFVLGGLFGVTASALDFRLWLGEKSLDELKVEDLFTIWAGRKPRRNFRDRFWLLVPFILGGDQKRERSGLARFLTWPRIVIVLLGLLVLTFGQGHGLWPPLFLSGLICLAIFLEGSSYAYKKALSPLDVEKLTLLSEEVSLARRQLASEQMMKHKTLELGLQFFGGSFIAAICLFIAIGGAISQWPLAITGIFAFLGAMGLFMIANAVYTLITGRWPEAPWTAYDNRPVTQRSEVQVLDIPERPVSLRIPVVIAAVGFTVFIGSGIVGAQLFGDQGQATIQCATGECVIPVIGSFVGLLLAIGGGASTVLMIAMRYVKRRRKQAQNP